MRGNTGRGRPRKTYIDLIGEILQKGQVLSTRNRRVCMVRYINVEDARGVCKNRSRWRSVVSDYPHGKNCEFMMSYVLSEVASLAFESPVLSFVRNIPNAVLGFIHLWLNHGVCPKIS